MLFFLNPQYFKIAIKILMDSKRIFPKFSFINTNISFYSRKKILNVVINLNSSLY